MATIAVDLDGVIANSLDAALAAFNRDHGTRFTSADIDAWDKALYLNGAEYRIGDMLHAFFMHDDNHEQIQPYPGAKEALEALCSSHTIVIATSRQVAPTHVSVRWLNDHKIPFHHYLPTNRAPKSLVRADVLIDDYPGNLADFPGGRVLFGQPWNANSYDYSNARAFDWNGVLRILTNLGYCKEPLAIAEVA